MPGSNKIWTLRLNFLPAPSVYFSCQDLRLISTVRQDNARISQPALTFLYLTPVTPRTGGLMLSYKHVRTDVYQPSSGDNRAIEKKVNLKDFVSKQKCIYRLVNKQLLLFSYFYRIIFYLNIFELFFIYIYCLNRHLTIDCNE